MNTGEEVEKLMNIEEGEETMGNESNETDKCDKRGPNSRRSKKKWTKEDDELLLKLAERTKGKCWKWISSKIPEKSDSQCRCRWERIRPGMKQGRWTVEEDELLLKLYHEHGEKWADIASHLVNRTGKQVRDRIKNVYDPTISHSKFKREDDLLIYRLYLEMGPKWKSIKAQYFPDRTPDFIKNRFYSHYHKFKALYNDNLEKLMKEIPQKEKKNIGTGAVPQTTAKKNDKSILDSSKDTSIQIPHQFKIPEFSGLKYSPNENLQIFSSNSMTSCSLNRNNSCFQDEKAKLLQELTVQVSNLMNFLNVLNQKIEMLNLKLNQNSSVYNCNNQNLTSLIGNILCKNNSNCFWSTDKALNNQNYQMNSPEDFLNLLAKVSSLTQSNKK